MQKRRKWRIIKHYYHVRGSLNAEEDIRVVFHRNFNGGLCVRITFTCEAEKNAFSRTDTIFEPDPLFIDRLHPRYRFRDAKTFFWRTVNPFSLNWSIDNKKMQHVCVRLCVNLSFSKHTARVFDWQEKKVKKGHFLPAVTAIFCSPKYLIVAGLKNMT